ncbi:MAG: OmpH family outer membrane protein [bacterium]
MTSAWERVFRTVRMTKLQSIATGIVLGLFILIGVLAIPRAGWAPPLIKMGVVNWEEIILQYEDYQQELKKLQQRRVKMMEFLRGQYDNVKGKKLKGKNPKNMSNEMRQIYRDTLKQIDDRQRKTREKYNRKIRRAIRQEAIKQGYSLILSENSVLYASEQYTDLTHSVIKRLNSKNSKKSSE